MVTRPIVDIQYCRKRVRVQFAVDKRGIAMKYDIIVNDKPVKVGVFAEEVMRWLGDACIRSQQNRRDQDE